MKTKIPYATGLGYAYGLIRIIAPHCERVEIAGSLRRKRAEVGDVEIVCVPKSVGDMFGNNYRFAIQVRHAIEKAGFKIESGGDHYIKAERNGVQHDIFLTSPEQWGVIFTIRTGDAEFSRRLVTPKNKGGWLPSCFNVKDGRVWAGNEVQETPEEKDFFKLAGLPWLEPEKRNVKDG